MPLWKCVQVHSSHLIQRHLGNFQNLLSILESQRQYFILFVVVKNWNEDTEVNLNVVLCMMVLGCLCNSEEELNSLNATNSINDGGSLCQWNGVAITEMLGLS